MLMFQKLKSLAMLRRVSLVEAWTGLTWIKIAPSSSWTDVQLISHVVSSYFLQNSTNSITLQWARFLSSTFKWKITITISMCPRTREKSSSRMKMRSLNIWDKNSMSSLKTYRGQRRMIVSRCLLMLNRVLWSKQQVTISS